MNRRTTSFKFYFLMYLFENEPQYYEDDMSSTKVLYWKEIVHDEAESILKN